MVAKAEIEESAHFQQLGKVQKGDQEIQANNLGGKLMRKIIVLKGWAVI